MLLLVALRIFLISPHHLPSFQELQAEAEAELLFSHPFHRRLQWKRG